MHKHAQTHCFCIGEPVFCSRFGHGRVVGAGRDPVVRFLRGHRAQVEGRDLRLVPEDEHREVVDRLIRSEEFGYRLVHSGRAEHADWSELLRADDRPLAERLAEAGRRPAIPGLAVLEEETLLPPCCRAHREKYGALVYEFP